MKFNVQHRTRAEDQREHGCGNGYQNFMIVYHICMCITSHTGFTILRPTALNTSVQRRVERTYKQENFQRTITVPSDTTCYYIVKEIIIVIVCTDKA